MRVTITGFRSMATDQGANRVPIGSGATGTANMTAAGTSSDSLGEGTSFARVATDTAITVDGMLFPAGSVEFIEARQGKTFTVATV